MFQPHPVQTYKDILDNCPLSTFCGNSLGKDLSCSSMAVSMTVYTMWSLLIDIVGDSSFRWIWMPIVSLRRKRGGGKRGLCAGDAILKLVVLEWDAQRTHIHLIVRWDILLAIQCMSQDLKMFKSIRYDLIQFNSIVLLIKDVITKKLYRNI